MNALTLRPRPIRSLTPLDDASSVTRVAPPNGHYVWLDASKKIEHGHEGELINNVHSGTEQPSVTR